MKEPEIFFVFTFVTSIDWVQDLPAGTPLGLAHTICRGMATLYRLPVLSCKPPEAAARTIQQP